MMNRVAMRKTIGAMLDGAMPERDAIATLTAIDLDNLSVAELAGAVDAVMERCISFPEFPDALDCCGTGGDGLHSLNISTAVAIVASACGLPIAKHGNRAVSSRSGSADILEALGVCTTLSPAKSAQNLRDIGLAFLFAPTYHPGFAKVASIRKTIGRRTIFNLLGPLCNPARPSRQLIGVFAEPYCQLVAQTAELLGRRHVAVVHGADGSDEISITTTTHCIEMIDGKMHPSILRPQDAGLRLYPANSINGGDAAFNADKLRRLLEGEPSAYADAVAFNCAMLLVIAEKTRTLDEGVTLSQSVIARGLANKKLAQLIEASQG